VSASERPEQEVQIDNVISEFVPSQD